MLLSDLKNPMSPTQAMPFNTHRSVLRLAMQALTQALGKLRAKMTHQEKENGGKGEDILVTLPSISAHCSRWTCVANVACTLCTQCRLVPLTGAAPTASSCVAGLVQSVLFLLTHQLQS